MSTITEPEQAPTQIDLDEYLTAYQSLYLTQAFYKSLPTATRALLEDTTGRYLVTQKEFSVIIEFSAPS